MSDCDAEARAIDAEVLLRWMSITAGAAERAIPIADKYGANPNTAAAVHAATVRVLTKLAAEIREEVTGGKSLASRVSECSPALGRNSAAIRSAFDLLG